MADHTQTPWAVTEEREWMGHSCCYDAAITAFVDGKRLTLAETNSTANAAFIVKAVNSHDALVEELQQIADNPCSDPSGNSDIASAALATIKERA